MKSIGYFLLSFFSSHIFYLNPFYKIRALLLKLSGASLGNNVSIRPGFVAWPKEAMPQLSIGEGTFINFDFRVELSSARVSIGRNCQIAARVSIECVSHGLEYVEGIGRGAISRDVKIGDRVWIGANAVILGGVEIGDDAVIGAGSIVTKSVETGCLYLGVPARKRKTMLARKQS